MGNGVSRRARLNLEVTVFCDLPTRFPLYVCGLFLPVWQRQYLYISVYAWILGPLLASAAVISTTQEVFKFDAPGFRQYNAILSPEGNACID